MEEFELVTLKSGIKSLRSRANKETFHPGTGPRLEATLLHVEQQRLVERSEAKGSRFVVWDVGLGAAANALTALESLARSSADIDFYSFDRDTGPLEFALAQAHELQYVLGHETLLRELMAKGEARPAPHIRWHLRLGDFGNVVNSAALPTPDAILYDPYSPNANTEMWTVDHFRKVRARLEPETPCLLTNYTRSTAVRATLLLAGFYVGIGCGVGEKDETTLASNCLEMLERPLDREWLKRVQISHSAAPLRHPPRQIAPMAPADFEALCALPQFT